MTSSNIAIAFVFFSNLVAIITLTYLLFRILGQTRETHNAMRGECERLHDMAKRTVHLLASTERLNEKLSSTYKMMEEQRNALQVPPHGLQQLIKLGDAVNPAVLDKVNRSVEELKGTLVQLYGQNQATAQKADDAAEVTTLEAIRVAAAHHSNEIAPLKRRLDELQELVSDLPRLLRTSDTDSKPSKALQDKLEEQDFLLRRATERAQRAEGTIEALEKSIEQLTTLVSQAGNATPQDAQHLHQELEALKHEHSALQRQLDDIQDTLKRTLIEKDFIEDKLLCLDEAVGELGTQANDSLKALTATSATSTH